MRYHEIFREAYINVRSDDQKAQYVDQVKSIIDHAYSAMGGHLNYPDSESLIRDDSWWKLVKRNNQIVALAMYKNRAGNKQITVATNGTSEGKRELLKMIADDIKLKRSWTEVSGPLAKFCIRSGVPPVPNEFAEEILGKEILELRGKFKYDRIIAGHVVTKMIVGYPNGHEYKFDGEFSSDDVTF